MVCQELYLKGLTLQRQQALLQNLRSLHCYSPKADFHKFSGVIHPDVLIPQVTLPGFPTQGPDVGLTNLSWLPQPLQLEVLVLSFLHSPVKEENFIEATQILISCFLLPMTPLQLFIIFLQCVMFSNKSSISTSFTSTSSHVSGAIQFSFTTHSLLSIHHSNLLLK